MNLATLIKLLTLAGLIAIMLSMGLKVTFAEVLAATRRRRLVVLGLVVNFVLVPAVTLGLLYLVEASPMVAVGFLILAVCPGAPFGPPVVALARGDVPCAIGQMVILAGLSALFSPALLSLLLPQLLPTGEMRIDFLAIVRTLVVAQMLPLALGLGIHHWAPRLTQRITKPVGLLANLAMLGVLGLVLVREHETLATIRLRGWMGMLALLTASLVLGWLCGGPGPATRKTLALTTGIRNAAVALVIVSDNFADTPAVSAVVVYALVSILAILGFALVLAAVANPTAGRLQTETRTP